MKLHQRFSIRKYKVGVASVLLGAVFLFAGVSQVSADQLTDTSNPVVVSEVETTATSTHQADDIAPTLDATSEVAASSANEVTSTDSAKNADSSSVATEVSESTEAAKEIAPESPSEEVATKSSATPTASETTVTSEDTKAFDQAAASTEKPSTTATVDKTTAATEGDHVAETESSIPKKEDAKPQSIDTNKIINVPKVWDSGYKGQGTVVAIIDSGLDVTHDALHISDVSKAKYKSKEEIEAAKKEAGISYGQWYNDKVIFGYNYVDVNTELKEADKHSHGMHVTGIATGNPTKINSGEYIYGVAPEAQVMFMRVFSDVHSTTGPAIYVQAIKDAVRLGADSINLSLGSANGSVVNMDNTIQEAIAMARKAGVTVVIAAGNDGAFGSSHSNPLAENPDYGLVGDPSTTRDVISVASYNSSTVMNKVVNLVGMEGNAALNNGKSSYTNPEVSAKNFEQGREYEYVFVGTGTADEVANVDLKGKIALVKRGGITFSEKIAFAAAKGAEGVVIFNHTAGQPNISMQIEGNGALIPSAFIPFEFGEELAAHPEKYKIQFNGNSEKTANPVANQMSDFTSWGLSVDGELKPDLSAPGGSIYSSINNGEYDNMSGTSMATPHVAGVVALVKQYLKQAYPDLSPADTETLIKHLLMSTAKAHYDTDAKAFTSPRQQGAGLVDTNGAITTGLYLTGSEGYSSVTLGNVGARFTFDVTVHNISKEDKTLNYVTNLTTDGIENGKITLKPRALSTSDAKTITVKAGEAKTVTISVDASTLATQLSQEMPNGYFLEGFVRFLDTVDSAEIVSLPFVGFKGKFQDVPVAEKPIYELVADGKGGFYYTPKNKVIAGNADVTGLISTSSEAVYSAASTDEKTPVELKVLGTFKTDEGINLLYLDANGKPQLAISPNGDGNQDALAFKGVFFRNYSDLVATIYAADDKDLKNPLWSSEPTGGNKNYYAGNPNRPKSTLVGTTEWFGQDKDGNDLPNGKYKYVVSYTSDVVGAGTQTTNFDVVLDREKPFITTATYDKTTLAFKARPAIEKESGVYRERVFYLVADSDGIESTIDYNANTGKVKLVDNKVFVKQNADGTFTLPLDKADVGRFYYSVEDFAGNVSVAKVADLISIGNDRGLVRVNVRDVVSNDVVGLHFTAAVKDDKGNTVLDLPRYAGQSDVLMLPFGTYTVEVFLYDKEWGEITGATKKTITLSEADSSQEVSFLATIFSKVNLLLDFDKALPKGTMVGIKASDGKVYEIPAARYSETDYGKAVYVENYTLDVALPEGVEIYEDLAFSVTPGLTNRVRFSLVDKRQLTAEEAQVDTVKASATYYNATEELIAAYDKALAEAKAVLAAKNKQAAVDQALQQLEVARQALNGKVTDFSVLQTESDSYNSVQPSAAYYNAAGDKQEAYNNSYRNAQAVLANEKVTQAEVDAATTAVATARQALDGKETDKSNLKAETAKYDDLLSSPTYYNAQSNLKDAYRAAYAVAEAVLQNGAARQVEVDKAYAALVAASNALDGKTTVSKEALLTALLDAQSVDTTDKTDASQEALKAAVETAQAVRLNEEATQEEVDAATKTLRLALEGLKPVEAVTTESVISFETQVVEDANLPAGTRQVLVAGIAGLRRQVSVNGKVLIDEVVTKAVTEVILVGTKTVDKAALSGLVAKSLELKATAATYQQASQLVKLAYDQAVREAQAVLANTNVTQSEVDEALLALKAAEEALDGKSVGGSDEKVVAKIAPVATNHTPSSPPEPEPRVSKQLPQTGTTRSPFLSIFGMVSILSAFGLMKIRKKE